eukprot:TRINITY_DN1795_c0_g1_i1.p1 TRINITY_DN1795_c0_g1~~TRINITY_DN1795_c0_g1_i1.p1  ORF type:complete len:82 (+),score=12.40 TRINITY_DN1795_c0_g1_i1:280-525(+)
MVDEWAVVHSKPRCTKRKYHKRKKNRLQLLLTLRYYCYCCCCVAASNDCVGFVSLSKAHDGITERRRSFVRTYERNVTLRT